MGFSGIFSSFSETFEAISEMLSAYSTVLMLLVALIGLFFAFFGFKLFKIFVGFLWGCVGLGIGFVVGSLIAIFADVPEALPLILAIVFFILFAFWGYKNPFALIKFAVGFATYAMSCVFFIGKFGNIEETWYLSCLLLPIIVTGLVCWIVGLILTAAVIFITSFGGAYLSVSTLLSLISVPFIITLILSLVLGVVCMIFQVKNAGGKKTKLKEFLFPKKDA